MNTRIRKLSKLVIIASLALVFFVPVARFSQVNGTQAASCASLGANWAYDTCGDTCSPHCRNTVTGETKPLPQESTDPGTGDDSVGDLPGIDLTIENVADIIYGFACWLWSVSMFAIVIAIIVVGLRMMWAQSNATAFDAARKAFVHVIVGAIVIMGVYVIIATVANGIGVNVSLLPFSCNAPDSGDEGGDDVADCKDACVDTAPTEAHCSVLSTQEARELCSSGAIYECQQKCGQ